jgi:hypothetical protein
MTPQKRYAAGLRYSEALESGSIEVLAEVKRLAESDDQLTELLKALDEEWTIEQAGRKTN